MPASVSSRALAKAAGIDRYFTGKPCKRDHIAERYTITGNCTICVKLRNVTNSSAYYVANAARLKAKGAERRALKPMLGKDYYAANREKSKAAARQWRIENAERVSNVARDYNLRNREKKHQKYLANREILAAQSAAWKAANPEKLAVYKAARRAREAGTGGSFTVDDIDWLKKKQKNRCAHAWCRASLNRKFHRDHIVPLSAGGSSDKRNIQLLCPRCNLRKHAQHPIDFAQKNGMLL